MPILARRSPALARRRRRPSLGRRRRVRETRLFPLPLNFQILNRFVALGSAFTPAPPGLTFRLAFTVLTPTVTGQTLIAPRPVTLKFHPLTPTVTNGAVPKIHIRRVVPRYEFIILDLCDGLGG